MISFAVAQRTREVGIRMAVGATAAQVVTWILRRGLRLALPGLAIGMLLAFGISRLLAAFLFGVSATDPVTFLAVPALLLASAILASGVPALRAARLEPMDALRSE